jgi:hypothetical protein
MGDIMKKLLIGIFVTCLLFSGCNQNKTAEEAALKEELKEEIKAELAAEQAEKEAVEAEGLKARLGVHEHVEGNTYILRGRLMPDEPPMGAHIDLETPLLIQRDHQEGLHTLNSILLPENSIYDYVARENFVYQEPFLTISSDSNISVVIKGDLSSLVAFDGPGDDFWPVDALEILSLNGEETLVDHSSEPFPLEVCKSIFFAYCYNEFDGRPHNVKEGYYYTNLDTPIGSLYKDAVDEILAQGYFFNQGEGDYYIEEEKTTYLDGEQQANLDYRLSLKEFVESYPPDRVEIGEVADYGLRTSRLYYDNAQMRVDVHHESKDYLSGRISGILLYGNELYLIDDMFVGMSLPQAQNMVESTYDVYDKGDPAARGGETWYSAPGTDLVVRFNAFYEPMLKGVDADNQVGNISLSIVWD